MAFSPFATVSNYAQMLNKIAGYTFGFALVCTILLKWQIPEVAALLDKLSWTIPVAGIDVALGVVVPAFILALVSRISKLHDKVSDVLGIRSRFDAEAILLPLALGSGVQLTADQVTRLRAERGRLMGDTFYRYASGTNPIIDKHYVTMALDHWSWYWILVEGCVVLAITAVILFHYSRPTAVALIEFAVLIIMFSLARIRVGCVGYALDEVREILRDAARKGDIAGVFRAL